MASQTLGRNGFVANGFKCAHMSHVYTDPDENRNLKVGHLLTSLVTDSDCYQVIRLFIFTKSVFISRIRSCTLSYKMGNVVS